MLWSSYNSSAPGLSYKYILISWLEKGTGFVPRISWKTTIFQKVSIKYYKYVKSTTLAFLLKVFLSNWSHENLIYCQLFFWKINPVMFFLAMGSKLESK